ncbi:hypothetical protein [Aeoliella mucimassa]|uniref:PEP-CTERM protein-sorting domain-containing protein n=1 Tax=Aeoliella mucimassa TaxID=2527972 RepID=A0A518AIS5_9BACT|nr:hypothetical protein [Aeoliella mucimassa]QDU54606.1 hypothetical protein Pan181_07890 [Aeoliella mucimassa]
MSPFSIGVRLAIAWLLASTALGQPQYTVTDITNWSPAELATLPTFDHYPLLTPVGASTTFMPTGQSGDRCIGQYEGAYGDHAARVEQGVQQSLPPLDTYYWWYTTCDRDDCHFYNGSVGYSHLNDVNSAGIAVGDSTLEGTGSSSSDYVTHAVLSTPDSNTLLDFTPLATRAAAMGINDAGQIVGWQRTDGPTQGIRWQPDGSSIVLDSFGSSVSPTAINDLGVVIGNAVVPEISYFNPEPFVSVAGAAIEQLSLPSQGGVEYASANDLNNTGLIVGYSWKATATTEPLATLWQQEPDDSWTPYDLNEIADGGDYIYERAVAVNDEGYVLALGKLDQDISPALLLLLTPDTLLSPVQQATGDYNFDGVIDQSDYQQWRRDFGRTISPAGTGADGNGNGIVDLGDYTLWRDHLQSAATSLATESIPEPSSPGLLLGLLALTAGFRQRLALH